MATIRNTLLLGVTCVAMAFSSAAFAAPAAEATSDTAAVEKTDAAADAGKTGEAKGKHKGAHKGKKGKKAKAEDKKPADAK